MAWSPFTALAKFRRARVLTTDEYTWARDVFGDTLPARERIRVGPALGLHRRPFTFPAFGGRITMYLGPQERDPVSTAPALFGHELTHVWQMYHARFLPLWLAKAIWTQLRFSLGHDVYSIGDATEPWASYTIEQQATVVEHWVAHRYDATGRRLQHYLDDDVRSAGQRSRPRAG